MPYLKNVIGFTRRFILKIIAILTGHKSPVSRLSIHLDRAYNFYNRGIYIYGWMLGTSDQYKSFGWSIGESESVRVIPPPPRTIRKDVFEIHGEVDPATPELGFMCWITADGSEQPSGKFTFHAEGLDGVRYESSREILPVDRSNNILKELFQLLTLNTPQFLEIMNSHLGPAIEIYWKNRPVPERQVKTLVYGNQPAEPKVSIIVPLYGRVDFIIYQLSIFANDASFKKDIDLIYVLDDPSLYAETISICNGAYPVYQVPFRVIYAGVNLGFGGANNLGAGHAAADYLLLLNSDVFPIRPGWVDQLYTSYTCVENIGALGPKLLYADNSIQHIGMQFKPHPVVPELWINDHIDKGLPDTGNPAGQTLKQVQAITGACIFIKKEYYDQLGGLDEEYIYGDFEDSDLCLKLAETGLACYVDTGIALYHLERQSMKLIGDQVWRQMVTGYNCWQHARKWKHRLEELDQSGVP